MVVIDINDTRTLYLASTMDVSETQTLGSTILGDNFNIIYIYPRTYQEVLKLNIYNIFSDIEYNIESYAIQLDRGRQGVYLDFDNDKEYLLRADTLSDELVWRGKALATTQTDLQNYTTIDEINNGIIKI